MFCIYVCVCVCVRVVYLVKSVFVLHWQYVILHEITLVNIAVISLNLRLRESLFWNQHFEWKQRETFTPQGPADGGLLSPGGGTFDAAG